MTATEIRPDTGPREGTATAAPAETATGDGDLAQPGVPVRLAVALALPTAAAGVMVGGVFRGVSPRPYAIVAGVAGVALATLVSRIRRPVAANALAVGGILVIGALMLVPVDPGLIGRIGDITRRAASDGDVLQPPVPFTAGWHVIVGWLMAIVGFAAGWVGLSLRRPSLGVLVPLPFAAIAGISVPEAQQIPSGVATLVLFAIGLALLSGEQTGDDAEARPPLAYELIKAVKAIPVVGVICVLLVFAAQSDLLFPDTIIDPAREPQRPRTVPITEVEDRALFEVAGGFSGPFRMGVLDVYEPSDGTWRLPPFAENRLARVPPDGVVNPDLTRGVQARFTIRGLGGAVLPGLPGTVGIVAERIPSTVSYDARAENIRLDDGQVEPGLTYTVVAAGRPKESDLRRVVFEVPPELEPFTRLPEAPPAVRELVEAAAAGTDNPWDRFLFLRNHVLENVVASGTGQPGPIPPARVQEILGQTLEANPYEIVALQAMLARWAGIPARIGYGFDCGRSACEEVAEGTLEVRPRNGASFPEVWFPRFGWLSITGTPRKAEPTVGSDPSTQQVDPAVAAVNEIAVQLFLPLETPPPSDLTRRVATALLAVLGLVAAVAAVYATWPGIRKARIRARRRAAARRDGPRARIALAYSEFRDLATDFGFRYDTDTPLQFLERFAPDDEHTELAWLVTRCLWGDLRDRLTDEDATAAEELSRSLRRRLAATQPATLRVVAALSRLSLRHPYSPDAAAERTGGWLRARRNGHRPRAGRTTGPAPVTAGGDGHEPVGSVAVAAPGGDTHA